MTAAELRQALAVLPDSAVLTLPVRELREALHTNGAAPPATRDPDTPDRLLSARETATRLGVSVRYIYAHRTAFPFTRELPGGAVRFSDHGLTRWLRRTP